MARLLHRAVVVFAACTAALASTDAPVYRMVPSAGPSLFELAPGEDPSPYELVSGGEGAQVRPKADPGWAEWDPEYPPSPVYPSHLIRSDEVQPRLLELSEQNMNYTLFKLINFRNRHWKSQWGVEAAVWLHRYIFDMILYNPIPVTANVTALPYKHPWPQPSIIVTIPGQTNTTIVLGAHIDTRRRWKHKTSLGKVPSEYVEDPDDIGKATGKADDRHYGADDNASGSVALVEILRVLLQDPRIAAGKQVNTIEFHWYSAGRIHQFGSRAIFREYWQKNRDIRAMLNHDMLGFVKSRTTPHIGVTPEDDGTSLVEFVMKCAEAYSFLPINTTFCPRDCSDHISARKYLFPSAMLQESGRELSAFIRTNPLKDRPRRVDLEHVREIAKVTLGFIYELGFYTFPPNRSPVRVPVYRCRRKCPWNQ